MIRYNRLSAGYIESNVKKSKGMTFIPYWDKCFLDKFRGDNLCVHAYSYAHPNPVMSFWDHVLNIYFALIIKSLMKRIRLSLS